MALPKRYETVAQLGALSTTGDPEGEITVTGRVLPDRRRCRSGEIRQRPPRHSAIKVGGERAYRRARRGEELRDARADRHGARFRAAVAPGRAADRRAARCAAYEIECSSGTYVRSLIADLQDAYCLELRRTAIGPFDVQEAVRAAAAGLEPLERSARCSSWPGRSSERCRAGCPPIGFAADVKVTRSARRRAGRSRSIAVGTFDGVHLGHREVIARRRQRARPSTPTRCRSSPRSTRRGCSPTPRARPT